MTNALILDLELVENITIEQVNKIYENLQSMKVNNNECLALVDNQVVLSSREQDRHVCFI